MQDKKENILSIGKVSKLLNIPRDTLRYFEQEGIVVPKKDRENHYRYYNDWDINFLIEYKRYRGYGFNVQETRQILHEDTLEDLRERMNRNQKYIEEKIKYYQMLYQRNEKYRQRLADAERRTGVYKLVDMPEIDYFPMRYNNQYLCREDIADMVTRWMEYFPFVDPVFVVRNPYDEDYECALSFSYEYGFDFLLPKNHLTVSVRKSKAVNTVIVAGGEHTFSTNLLKDTFAYIEDQGWTPEGPVIGYYLARVQEGDQYKRYLDVFVPVQGITGGKSARYQISS